MGSVNITIASGGLGGTLATNDGVVGMVLTGGIDSGGYVLGTPKLVTGLASVAAAGITADGNSWALRQITDFYTMAGDGAQLYIMLVPTTMIVSDMADNANADSAKKLLDYADGAIKVLGIMTNDDTISTPTVTNALNADIEAAKTNLQVMATAYATAQKPFRGVIGGTSYSGTAADLNSVNSETKNRVAVLIGDRLTGKSACLGLLLGKVAAIPVQRKVSRVRDGALPITTAFVGTVALSASTSDTAVIAGKGYITFTPYANVSGFYFSGDPMCAEVTDDYAMLARGRVIDKAHRLAYATFVKEIDDEVPVNADGTLDAGYCKWLSQQMENQINNSMTVKKEISSVTCYIDPAQNILSTNILAVSMSIIPVGYATVINVSLGFTNPNA